MHLTDLNQDCQYLILEQLSLPDLFNISSTNHYFHDLALDVFRRKYGKQSFEIFGSFFDEPFENVYETDISIIIEDFDWILKIFQTFGRYISLIRIWYEKILSDDKLHQLNKILSEFCSETLTEMIFDEMKVDALNDFQKPFTNVKEIELVGKIDKFGSRYLSFSELFPNVENLILGYLQVNDRESLQFKLPFLKSITVVLLNINGLQLDDVEKFIKLNPQIKCVRFRYFPSKILPILSENLPNVESLEVPFGFKDEDVFDVENEMHFKNVKNLDIQCDSKIFLKMKFQHLEKIRLSCYQQISNEWIDFITEHKFLWDLKITYGKINDEQLLKIGNELTNLKEMTLAYRPDINIQTIFDFLERCQNLIKLTLINDLVIDSEHKELPDWEFDRKEFTEKLRNWQFSITQRRIIIKR